MRDSDLTRDSIRETAYAFQRSRILLTAHELGILSAVGGRPESSENVARKLGTDSRATDRLMNALDMLVGTAAGDTYTESEVRNWIREAGLAEIETVETPFGTRQMRGRKSAAV